MAYVFVSDLHLDGSQPRAIEQFVEFLGTEARSARALYVLGDLFETWLGDDLIDEPRARVCQALRKLAAGGVPIFVMRGNRDFLLDREFAAQTGARLLPDPVVLEIDGVTTLLTHGDLLCTDDRNYQQLRSLVNEPGWRRRLLALSATTRNALAAIARAGSRKHMAQARPSIMDVNTATVERVFSTANVQLMIHGHTHRPGVHQHVVDGKRCTRVVLDSWFEDGQCIRVDGGRIEEWRLGAGIRSLADLSESGTAHPAPSPVRLLPQQ